jgi:hypothetical protein
MEEPRELKNSSRDVFSNDGLCMYHGLGGGEDRFILLVGN